MELIDREKLIVQYSANSEANGFMELALDDSVVEALKKAELIDAVEVVHGKWVYDHWCEFKCSVCGEYSNSKPYKGKENYCPNCGAKMDLK